MKRSGAQIGRIITCLFFLLAVGEEKALAQGAAEEVLAIPTPQEIRQLPLRSHPRLYATAERFEELKHQIATDPLVRAWYKDVKRQADEYLNAESPRYEIEDGLRLIYVTSRIRDRVHTLGLVYHIEGDRRYADRVWEELKAAASFPDWNPRHFLDTAEMTQAFAIGYDWLYEVWTEEQRRFLRETMIEKGLQVALDAYRSGKRWTRMQHIYNWGQVTNGGIGLGALAILEDRPSFASRVLYEAIRRLPAPMSHYAPDGGWIEGVEYWHFATRYTAYLLSSLDNAFGTSFGLSKLPGFSETGFVPIYMTGPFGRSFNHSDSSPDAIRGAELFWLAGKFNRPAFAAHQRRVAEPTAIDLLWYEPEVAEMKNVLPSLPLDRHFPASHIALMRSSWTDPRALFVGLKGGNNDASHAHLDQGSFILDALGERWAIELGAEDYNVPGYFAMDTKRWIYYRTRAEGQNALVIEPGSTPDQKIMAVSKIERFESHPERAFAIVDVTPAYEDHVSSVQRGVKLVDDRRQVLVQDEIRAEDPVDASWFMHTRARIEIDEQDPTEATLYQGGKRLWAKIVAPTSARFTDRPARPLPESPSPEEQSPNRGVRKLAIQMKDVSSGRIAVLLVPLEEGSRPPSSLPALRPLASW